MKMKAGCNTSPIMFRALVAVLSCAAGFCEVDEKWVSVWEAAPQLTEVANNPPLPLAGTVVRQILRPSAGGTQLRVLFCNIFGGGPLTIVAAHVAASVSGAGEPMDSRIQPATDTPLTFAGLVSAVIPEGESLWSDSLSFNVLPLTSIAVTTAFGNASLSVSGHPGSRTTSYQATGTDVSEPSMASAASAAHWWVLAGLNVAGGPATRAVVALGDSITDGRGSTTDSNNRWPDVLAARMLAPDSPAHNASLVNAGIGGNAITGGGLGPTAEARFDRDVLNQSAVGGVIIFEGVNDIGAGVSAAAVIAGLTSLRDRAVAASLSVIVGATITPFGGNGYYTAAHEAARQAVNAHIRSAFNAVIDFDALMSDGGQPPKLKPEYDSGDGLHPNPAGYQAMANAVDLSLFAHLA